MPTPKEEQEVSFAERESALAAREAEIAEREAAAEDRERAAQASIRQAQHAANVSFAEGLIGQGKLAPAGKELMVGVMDHLEATATVSFGEANGELAPLQAFKRLFDDAKALISFGELAPGGQDDEAAEAVSFAAPEGYAADPKQLAIHRRALQLQAEDKSLSYLDAVQRAQAS